MHDTFHILPVNLFREGEWVCSKYIVYLRSTLFVQNLLCPLLAEHFAGKKHFHFSLAPENSDLEENCVRFSLGILAREM